MKHPSRLILASAFLLFLSFQITQFPLVTSAGAAPSRTTDLNATATRVQAKINAAATKTFIRQYRAVGSLTQVNRYSRGGQRNVSFTGVIGLILNPTLAWVKMIGGFVLVHTDAPFEAQPGSRVTVYASLNGRIDLAIGGQPANIPNLEHGVIVNSGRVAALTALEPTAIPPTPTPTFTPVPPSANAGNPGNGATALCNDGTYSFAATHRGACSRHGGVAQWYK